jgi:hypothetical protein
MSSKRIEIFEKASNHFKKASHSLKMSLKLHAFLKKSLAFTKKSLVAIAASPQWPVRPLSDLFPLSVISWSSIS